MDCGVQFEESRVTIGKWSEEPVYSGPEQRRSTRVPTDDPAVMTVIGPERSPRLAVRILDASKEGMKLQVPAAMLTGTIIQVHVRDLFVLAEVRYCVPADAVFHAGIRIHDVFPACG